MKAKAMQFIAAALIGSFGTALMAAESTDASHAMVQGNFDLPVYPGSILSEKPGLGISGGMSYMYHSSDSVDVVYAWYKGKLPGAGARESARKGRIVHSVPGSKYVNVMVVISNKGGTDIALSP